MCWPTHADRRVGRHPDPDRGVVVKAAIHQQRHPVNGALAIQGTAANPVIFTSYKDDTSAATPTATAQPVRPPRVTGNKSTLAPPAR